MRATLLPCLFLLVIIFLSAACGGGGDGGGDLDHGIQDGSGSETLADGDGGAAGEEEAGEIRGQFEPVPPHVEQREQFTILWLSGTPYEMGYQQGELLHDVIAEAMEFVMADVTLASIPILARDMGLIEIAELNSYDDVLEECQGLVDGAAGTGFTMDLCLVLNFGDVLLEFMTHGIPEGSPRGPGCSSAIVSGGATPDGRLRHARNLDWGSMNIDIIHQHPVIQVRQPTDGIAHVVIGFPLNLSPYTGMNLAGISIGSHEADAVGTEELSPTGRSHVQMVGQLLKHAQSMDDVRAVVDGEPHMSAEIFSVGDGDGQAGSIFEMTATLARERPQEDGYVYATNHFVQPEMVAKQAPPATGSKARFTRFSQRVVPGTEVSLYGQLDETGLGELMRDPYDPISGKERTEEELAALNWDNDGSLGCNGPMHFVIFDPEKRLFWVDAGELPLYTHAYTCFSLSELLGLPDGESCPAGELASPYAK